MKRSFVFLGLAPFVLTGAVFGASVTRSFNPATYTPGQQVTVTLTVSATGAAAQAIEDHAPAGWTVSNASDSGNASGTRAAWFFLDGNNRTLTYQATPPSGQSGPKTFTGEGAFDGATSAIGGSSTISTAGGASARVTRSFNPTSYTPGQPVTVTLAVTPGGAAAQAIEDHSPAGWTVASASDGGNASGTRVAWFFLDGNNRSLTYQATPPAGESGAKTFSGEGAFDGSTEAIGGSSTISLMTGPPPCTTATKLCLDNNRFTLTLDFKAAGGQQGAAQVAKERDGVLPAGTPNSGAFWFFDAGNWEMLVKVLNGCGLNNNYWVFFAATTNVEFKLTVTDTQTNSTKQYTNPLNNAALPVQDINAFATCP